MIITNKVFNNFYTNEEKMVLFNYIEDTVKKSNMYYIQPELGRYYATISEKYMTDCIGGFPDDLLNKVKSFAENFFKVQNLIVFDIVMVDYSNRDGLIPRLPYHKDNGVTKKYTLDYQYNSNIDWPLGVDDKEFILKPNDILTFLGSNQYHGRPDRIFKDGEFVENIFFQFVKKRG
jgi:hypothetical protein